MRRAGGYSFRRTIRVLSQTRLANCSTIQREEALFLYPRANRREDSAGAQSQTLISSS